MIGCLLLSLGGISGYIFLLAMLASKLDGTVCDGRFVLGAGAIAPLVIGAWLLYR